MNRDRAFPTTYRGTRLQVTVLLDPDQVAAMDQVAAFKRTSRAALVREALDFFLASNISEIHINATDVAVARDVA